MGHYVGLSCTPNNWRNSGMTCHLRANKFDVVKNCCCFCCFLSEIHTTKILVEFFVFCCSFKLQGNQANHKIRRSLLGLGKAGLGDALSTISESAVVFYDGKGTWFRSQLLINKTYNWQPHFSSFFNRIKFALFAFVSAKF